jgi:hypothetical protein
MKVNKPMLYISKGVRNIIVEETAKMEKIKNSQK